MAVHEKLISGHWSEGIKTERFRYEVSEEAISYYSITFLDMYKEHTAKLNNDEAFKYIEYGDSCTVDCTMIRGYNTFDDFMLIPSGAPIIQLSQVTPTYTDLNAWDGSIDETQVLKNNNNGMYWQMISGNWEFMLSTDYKYHWISFYYWYTDLLEAIHGQSKIISLSEDFDTVYTGRVMVEEVSDPANGDNITVTLAYNIQPILYSGNTDDMLNYYKTGTLTKYNNTLLIEE